MPTQPPLNPAPSLPVPHGGDLSEACRLFPEAPQPWIDLSTGINPHGFPFHAIAGEVWRRLPDRDLVDAVEAASRRRYGASPRAEVVAGPGTQAFIQALPRLLPARRVSILGFGYQEHPAAWRASGAEVVVADKIERLAEADVAVVVNPNNPDGRLVEPEALLALSRRLAAQGGTLVVDEAFMDAMEPVASLAPYAGTEGLVVLRSVGKFYGLAGIRLGFALAAGELAGRLRAALGPWAVAGPALEIGRQALDDGDWQVAERARLGEAAWRLDACLSVGGLRVVGGTPLFRLVEDEAAASWFDRLGRAGILVRRFADRPNWLRFGLPGDDAAWARLSSVVLR